MSNPRRANSTKRNKLIARVKREESTCHLCGQWVDVRLPHGLPGSPEIDELIPVAYGGNPYDRTNCRLANRWCNRYRWTRPVDQVRAELVADPPIFDADGAYLGRRSTYERPQPVVSRDW